MKPPCPGTCYAGYFVSSQSWSLSQRYRGSLVDYTATWYSYVTLDYLFPSQWLAVLDRQRHNLHYNSIASIGSKFATSRKYDTQSYLVRPLKNRLVVFCIFWILCVLPRDTVVICWIAVLKDG